MKLFTFQFLVFFTLFLNNTQSARILAVFPVPGRSHFILGNTLMRALADKGHDVTVISPFVDKNPTKNGSYTNIPMESLLEDMEAHRNTTSFFDMGSAPPFLILPFIIRMTMKSSEKVLMHENVQKLLKSNSKFDVVIVEEFMNPAHKSFAQFYDAPLVVLSPSGPAWVNNFVGNPAPPSYVPEILLTYAGKMTFLQRVYNTLLRTVFDVLNNVYVFPNQAAMVQKHLAKSLDMYNILYNISLVLLNSHQSIYDPVPYVPNLIDIGGFHVKAPKKLPEDLQRFLDDAPNGVIYFSMGSNLRSSEMPEAKRNEFLKVFSKLKQKVLWKWEEDNLPGQPANLKTGKWLPQQDILAHPNVKVFITHGGLLSTTETTYHGVPTLAIPIYGDQAMNAKILERNQVGLVLPYKEISEETLTEKLKELLTNPRFDRNAKKRSELFRDRLVHPLDTAVYWVEYVIRHRGAPHLRVAGVDLPWYQYYLLDVIGFLIISVVVFSYLSLLVLTAIYRKLIRKKVPAGSKMKKH